MKARKDSDSLTTPRTRGAKKGAKPGGVSDRPCDRTTLEPSYVFKVDTALCIISLGRELEEICGREQSEIVGLPYYEVFPRILSGGGDAVEEVLGKGKPLTVRACTSVCFYGSVNADVEVTPLFNEKGKVDGAAVRFHATPACTLYSELQRSQPLIDIGKIASSLAHGVRNPLNAIKGAVVYLNERYAAERTLVEFTRIIEEEISRLDNFIARFLSSSIVEEGLSEANINAVVRKAEVLVSFQAQSRKIKTFFDYGPALPVTVNAFHLEQAVFNVVNNAIEAMGSGGQLTVKTGMEIREGGRYSVVEVRDTGSGMSDTKGNELSESSTKKGRGFGLFLTREFLRYYGGHLEIESRKGVSTTVRLYLPLHGASTKK